MNRTIVSPFRPGLSSPIGRRRRGGLQNGPLRVAIFGDSLTFQNTTNTASLKRYEDDGYWIWANALSGNRYLFDFDYNQGVSGNQTSTMDSRKETDLGGLSSTPDVVVFMGGTNDITASTTSAATISNINSIVSYITDTLGAVCAIMTVPPRDATASAALSAAQQTKLDEINAHIRTLGSANVLIVDHYASFHAGDNRPIADLYGDNYLHWGTAGAYIAGSALADVLATKFGRYAVSDLSGTELTSNPTLSGTGGFVSSEFSGSFAAGWDVDATQGSGTVGKNGDLQNVTWSHSAGSALASITIDLPSDLTTGFSAGEAVFGYADVTLNSATNLRGIKIELQDKESGAVTQSYLLNNTLDHILDDAAGDSFILVTPNAALAGGVDAVFFRLQFFFDSSTSASVDFDIRQMGVRNIG